MIKAILLSGSRATKLTSRFSDWDYLVFTDTYLEFAYLRIFLRQRHYPIETHVNWGNERTDEELYRSLCFSKLIYSWDTFYSYLLNKIYPEKVYPTYQESQNLIARGRLQNVYRFFSEANYKALQPVTTNLAHQRAKLLKLPMPEQKEDLVTILNWDEATEVYTFAEACVSDIERCHTEISIEPFIGYQRDILGRKKGRRLRSLY